MIPQDTLGVIVTARSLAAAWEALTNSAAAGATISTANPVYFDVGGILYKADGTKVDGDWVLNPVDPGQLASITARELAHEPHEAK